MERAHRQTIGAYGALTSWGRTVDRSARTAPARRNSPASIEYWLDRLDPERFADATQEQRLAAAESARKAHMAKLAMRSAKARRRNRGGAADAA